MAFPKAQKDLEKALIRNLEGVKQKQAEIVNMWFRERKHDAKIISRDLSGVFERSIYEGDENFLTLQEYIETLRKEYGYKAIYITSRDGVVLVSTDEHLLGSNVIKFDYCREALNGKLFLSEIKRSTKTDHRGEMNDLTMLISAPLIDNKNIIVGAVILKVDIFPLNIIMKNAKLGKTGETFLIDKKGFMLTDSRFVDEMRKNRKIKQSSVLELRVDVPENENPTFIQFFLSFWGADWSMTQSNTLTEGVKKCLEKESGYDTEGYKNYNGKKVLGAWCWIKEYDCGLLTQIDKEEGYGPAYNLKKFVHTMLLVLATPLTMAAFYFGRRISSPILNMTEVTEKITSGDLGQRVKVSGKKDEISKLGLTFNIMAESLEEKTIKLRKYTTDLEDVVKERTLKLQSTTNFLNSILAGSTEYSIIAEDLEGNILAFNEGASLIYGYKAEEVVGKANVRMLHLEDDVKSGKVNQLLEMALKTGRFDGEVMRRRKNGEIFPVHVTVTLRKDENGEPAGFVVISKDITKEKLIALEKDIINNINKIIASGLDIKEIYESLYSELKRMINFNWLGVVYLIAGTEVTDVSNIIDGEELSKDWLDYQQYPFHEMAQDVSLKKDVPVYVSNTFDGKYKIDHELKEKNINSYVCFPLKSKGVAIGTLTLGSNRRDAFTEVHFSLLHQIIPQLAIAIENTRLFLTIRESEEKYRDLVENAPEMIHEISPEGKFINVNKTELNKLGYSLGEMRELTLEDIVPANFREEIRRHIKLIKETRSSELETVFLTKAGKELNVEINGTSLYNTKTGECLRMRAFVRDISERKKMEEQVRRSEKLASMGELAAAIAHEIRNPLGAICNSVGILDSRLKLSGQEKDLLELIIEQSERLDRIISDFLAFAHPREPSFSVRDIREVVKNTICLLQQDTRFTDNVRIKTIYESILPTVYIDADLIHQILWNLLVNSLDAMPDGGQIRITVRKTTLFLRSAVEIVIADTGVGMPEKELIKIFEPFFTTKSEGTGLGLSVVQRIIDDHGGTLDVKSKTGKGTTFYIKLPVGNEKLLV